MIDIEYLEHKKSEIVAEHVRLYHDTKLTKAEQIVIDDLNWQIKQLKMAERKEV